MAETKIGKAYRDRITGVVGVATEKGEEPAPRTGENPKRTQLRLAREHLDGSHEAQAADMRWYDDDRLDPVTGG